MASTVDATILICDIANNADNKKSGDGPTFFDQAKTCLEAIVMRKIFTKPKDELSLLLMGSIMTENDLNTNHGGYENISFGFPMKPISWEMLEFVTDLTSTSKTSDWMDAIYVAMDYFRSLELVKVSKKIVLLTDFINKVDADTIDVMINGLKEMDIELIVITTNVVYEKCNFIDTENVVFSQTSQKSQFRAINETLIKKIVDETNGILCGMDEAMPKLIYLDKRHRRRVPWNADLSFGTKLNIKIAALIYLRDQKELPAWKTVSAGTDKCYTKTEFYHNDEKMTDQDNIDELIKGHRYGETNVPFEDTEEFDNGGKGLKVIGFTDISRIRDEYLAGTGIWLITSQKGYQNAPKMLAVLSKYMSNSKLALICRYTYNNRSAPKMMVLFPQSTVTENGEQNILLMHELFFKDNFVEISFPSLSSKKTEPSDDQSELIDKFIDEMDLMKGNGDEDTGFEYFKKLLDPGLQHIYRAIAHRALNPRDPLLAPDKDILNMVTSPKANEVHEIVEEMKKLFPLEEAKASNKEILMERLRKLDTDTVQGDGMPTDNANVDELNTSRDIVEVGTIAPAEDFAELLYRGERFDTLAVQIEIVITNIVLKSVVLLKEKVIKAVFAYRETAKQKGPFKYNEWIEKFKQILQQNGKSHLWSTLIVDEKLGKITANECEWSTVTEKDAEEFLRLNEKAGQTQAMFENDDENLDDMFADM